MPPKMANGFARHRLVDDLASRLDLAVELLRELLRLLARARADEDVRPPAHDVLPLLLEPVGERVRLLVRRALDADLPGRVPALEHLLLPALVLRLVVPASLVGEPVLDADDERLDGGLLEFGLDDLARLLGLEARRRVDEDRVPVARDGEALGLRAPWRAPSPWSRDRSRAPRGTRRRARSSSSTRMRQSSRAMAALRLPAPPTAKRITQSAQLRLTCVTISALRSKPGGQGRRPRGKANGI